MERFVAETRTQRRIVNAVNGRFGEPSLNGLWPAAIDRWRATALNGREQLSALLYQIAKVHSSRYDETSLQNLIDADYAEDLDGIIRTIQAA
jgi:hypothetical protein